MNAPDLGTVVRDISRMRVGRVMGRVGPHYQLRPLNGGVEWEAPAEDLVPAEQSDAMSAEGSEGERTQSNEALTVCPIRKFLYRLHIDHGHHLYWAMIATLPAVLLWVLFSWVL